MIGAVRRFEVREAGERASAVIAEVSRKILPESNKDFKLMEFFFPIVIGIKSKL